MPSPPALATRLAGAVSFAALLSACGTPLQSWNETVPCGAGTVTYRVRNFDTKTQMFVGFSEPYDPKLYQGIYADVEISNGDRFPRYYFAKASNFRYFDYPLGTGNRVTIHCPGKTYVYQTEDVTDGVESDRAFSRNLADFNAGMKAQAEEKKRRDNELGYSISQGKAILAERERAANAGSTAPAGGSTTTIDTSTTSTTSTTATTTSTNNGASSGARPQAVGAGQGSGQPAQTGATGATPGGSGKSAAPTSSKTSSAGTSQGKSSGAYLVVDTKAADQRKAFQAQEAARAKQAASDKAERDRAADAIRAKADAQSQADWARVQAEMKARGNKQ